jgi:hypothetical protein
MIKILIVGLLGAILCTLKCVPETDHGLPQGTSAISNLTATRIASHLDNIRKLIAKNEKYSREIAFLVDMKIPSGKNRFFIYDLKANKIIDQGLVAHGSGSETGIQGRLKFSNINNSLSSSLGRYYVGKSYNGRFGKAYKLYGLDKTNSNAYDRNIVLHEFERVPYTEQDEPICNSLGCPMINEKYYMRIEKILDDSKKFIILNIYY